MTTVFLLFLMPMVMIELSAHRGRILDHAHATDSLAIAAVESIRRCYALREQNLGSISGLRVRNHFGRVRPDPLIDNHAAPLRLDQP